MDQIALALCDYRHQWTKRQRNAYQAAQYTLCQELKHPYWLRRTVGRSNEKLTEPGEHTISKRDRQAEPDES